MIETQEIQTPLSTGKGGYGIIEFKLTATDGPVRPTATIQWISTDQHKALSTLEDWLNQHKYKAQLPYHKQVVSLSAGPRSEIVKNPYTSQFNTLVWE